MRFCEEAPVILACGRCNSITQAHDGPHPVSEQINRMRAGLDWDDDHLLRLHLAELIPTRMTETIQRIVMPALREAATKESLFQRVFRQTTT